MADRIIMVSEVLTEAEQAIVLERFHRSHPGSSERHIPDVLEAADEKGIHRQTVLRMQASYQDMARADPQLVAAATLAVLYLDGEATSPRVLELMTRVWDSPNASLL